MAVSYMNVQKFKPLHINGHSHTGVSYIHTYVQSCVGTRYLLSFLVVFGALQMHMILIGECLCKERLS